MLAAIEAMKLQTDSKPLSHRNHTEALNVADKLMRGDDSWFNYCSTYYTHINISKTFLVVVDELSNTLDLSHTEMQPLYLSITYYCYFNVEKS